VAMRFPGARKVRYSYSIGVLGPVKSSKNLHGGGMLSLSNPRHWNDSGAGGVVFARLASCGTAIRGPKRRKQEKRNRTDLLPLLFSFGIL